MTNRKYQTLPSVSVVVPAFNEELYIKDTLNALLASRYPKENLEIIVVDNGSTDETVNIAREYADQVLLLETGNVGAVRNLGAKTSKFEMLVFLDADCLVDDGWIMRGVNLLCTDAVSVYGGPCKMRNGANWIERLWLLENPKYPRIQPDLLGGCIFIKSSTFSSIGGFNETMTSGEDSDLSERLRKAGYNIKISSQISVIHLGNPRTVSHFITRQIWHAENYLLFLRASIRDHTFWLVIFFILGIILIALSLPFGSPIALLTGTFLAAASVSTLSLKRIILTRFRPRGVADMVGIFTLDFLYLSGRSIGTIKSIVERLKKSDKTF